MKYVLGAGVSGLLWAYYHQDYHIITDEIGRALTGADPLIWLNVTKHTERLLKDLSVDAKIISKPIGYRTAYGVVFHSELEDSEIKALLLKKMVPWPMIRNGGFIGAELDIGVPRRQFTKDSGVITYWDLDLRAMLSRLLGAVKDRITYGRVKVIDDDGIYMTVPDRGVLEFTQYEHVVSTLPAPTFARLYKGNPTWRPEFHYAPVTFVISKKAPDWWSDRYAMIYDADLGSPISRTGRFGDQYRHEVTGWMQAEDLPELEPVSEGVFAHPYGRIFQDFDLKPPNDRIQFLGRVGRWDYRGLIDMELEVVHA